MLVIPKKVSKQSLQILYGNVAPFHNKYQITARGLNTGRGSNTVHFTLGGLHILCNKHT